jgi:Carboxypeptidase regulatory-like domain
LGRKARRPVLGPGSVLWLSLCALLGGIPALAQSQQAPNVPETGSAQLGAPETGASASQKQPDPRLSGSISGTIVDRNGSGIAGALVRIAQEGQSPNQEVLSGDDGQFSLANIAPGHFQLTITAAGFATQSISGTLGSGQNYIVPQVTLAVATNVTEVRVELSPIELAQEEIRDEEKQRVLGVIPNFYVSYVPKAVALTSKQKFELAWKTTLDPVSFGVTGAVAGVQQATNEFSGYGQGAQGYGKRYGASYADLVTGTFIGSAILPSLLKQDPRYFYKGSGSVRSRLLYAIANSVICKGDNGHWQPNYSSMLGSLAAGGISNLYYPSTDRNGAALTFENTLIGIGETAAVNVLQEFVMRKLTSNVPSQAAAEP